MVKYMCCKGMLHVPGTLKDVLCYIGASERGYPEKAPARARNARRPLLAPGCSKIFQVCVH